MQMHTRPCVVSFIHAHANVHGDGGVVVRANVTLRLVTLRKRHDENKNSAARYQHVEANTLLFVITLKQHDS